MHRLFSCEKLCVYGDNKLLQTCLTTVAALSERALASDSAAQQRFGALLAKAFQFPAANYVYLVGGSPSSPFGGLLILTKNLELTP